ncbi:hypothetical protein [Nocardioides sp. zg-1228]|uniref:hypothetical protein n=1 Tax=Nocardioides sp. zg-1228 TaxID=2763008 RepID=UPI0016425DFA|nr:hypothetical protein [Nocardioides sp. zg-1228]MBC2934779.1 hypothetical protein [Nocardioides sp. zg-1228]QSF58430.1 hypothetical protein JX575_04270 [Nocardioides sp. zg-1228]
MSTPLPDPASFARSTRVLAATLMGGLVVVGVVLAVVLPAPVWGGEALVVLAVQVVAGVAAHLVLETIGYRTPALSTDLTDADAAARARTRWQSSMILRFAISESIAIVSIAAAFVLADGSILTYLGGAAVSLALMLVHVWPSARPVGKVAEALEADGRRSGLRESFGLSSSGAIQRL